LRRKTPDKGVVDWFSKRPATTFYLSVLTLGEVRKGIAGLSESNRKTALLDWFETELPIFFAGRILMIDADVADRWGKMIAAAGRPLPSIDGLIGATAAFHGITLVTRNTKNFSDMGLELINPWSK
jgi:predicted nucleic acid-binding protein